MHAFRTATPLAILSGRCAICPLYTAQHNKYRVDSRNVSHHQILSGHYDLHARCTAEGRHAASTEINNYCDRFARTPQPAPRAAQLHTRNRSGDPGIVTEIEPIETGNVNSKRLRHRTSWGLGQTPTQRRTQRQLRNRALIRFRVTRRDPPGDNLLDKHGQHFPFVP